MFGKASLGVLLIAGILVAAPIDDAMAGSAVPIQGVWTCAVLRAGTVLRPLMYTFNADGTFNYSSATTINSIVAGPVQDSGFHSRGGARGQWTKVASNLVNYQSVEFLYDALGNLAGSFAVDADLLITTDGKLCSGRAECPNQTTSVSLVKYGFADSPASNDGNIVTVTYLLGPDAPANVLCNSFSSGAGFPSLPIPMP